MRMPIRSSTKRGCVPRQETTDAIKALIVNVRSSAAIGSDCPLPRLGGPHPPLTINESGVGILGLVVRSAIPARCQPVFAWQPDNTRQTRRLAFLKSSTCRPGVLPRPSGTSWLKYLRALLLFLPNAPCLTFSSRLYTYQSLVRLKICIF